MTILNEERVVSGFPEVTDLSAIEAEIQERRRHYRKVIKSALDNLAPKELVEAVTVAVESATEDGEEHGPILIADLVDSYEVEAQGFLEKEEGNIRALVERLRAAVDAERPDSALAPMVNQLIQVVKNWHTVAQPIQISTKSRGLDHDASHRVAGLVRSLAIHMFNEHGKLDFSQQLTSMLQEVFAEVGDVAERTAEDADALEGIAEQRALHAEVCKIEELTTQIKADVDSGRPDSYLSQRVDHLCQLVMNWRIDTAHDASLHAAWLVRDLAIHMFNKHDKLDFSQQLTKTLLSVFEDAGEISNRIIDDAKALQEIASNRSKLVAQFREFNLNGNSFDYKGRAYSTIVLLTRDDDDFGKRVFGQELGECTKAFHIAVGMGGQPEVKGNQGRFLPLEELQGLLPVPSQENLIILSQCPLHGKLNVFVVFNDEQFGLFHELS